MAWTANRAGNGCNWAWMLWLTATVRLLRAPPQPFTGPHAPPPVRPGSTASPLPAICANGCSPPWCAKSLQATFCQFAKKKHRPGDGRAVPWCRVFCRGGFQGKKQLVQERVYQVYNGENPALLKYGQSWPSRSR
jgi:hypothetical protein